MKTALRLAAISALCLSLTGCPQVLDAFLNSQNPHSLSATRGQGTTIEVSWSSPDLDTDDDDKDDREVTSYTVYRDGIEVGTTSSTGWTDDGATPAVEHSYYVTATFDDSSTSDSSNSEDGWYVPGRALSLGTGPGESTNPGHAVSTDGWFRTIVVKGWTYHVRVDSATDFSVCNWKSPWQDTSIGLGTKEAKWKATRTGEVWIKISQIEPVEAWYE